MSLISELIQIPIGRSGRVDVYSGVQRLAGRIFGQLVRPDSGNASTVLLITHPSSAFLGHYLLRPLAEAGVHAVGLNTRYAGNDTNLIVENVLLDLASTIQSLHERGYENVILVGNSGGGAIVAYYQAQAEHPEVIESASGDSIDLTNLPKAAGLMFVAVHSSRARVMTEWLDPSLIDEHDPFAIDPALNMYNPRNGPPYSVDFLDHYRGAQIERNRRITARCHEQLQKAAAHGLAGANPAFVLHRTLAEPAFLDLSIEPSDRQPCRLWGDPAEANINASSLGRYSSCQSWLSQFSWDEAPADALRHLPRVTAPVLMVQGTADECVLPHHPTSMYEAIHQAEKRLVWIPGGGHYLVEPEPLSQAVAAISGWLTDRDFC